MMARTRHARYTPTTTFETFPFPWPNQKESPASTSAVEIGVAARDLMAKREAWLHAPGLSKAEQEMRTLTHLYNHQPAWLRHLHQKLDCAVLDAYGWPHDLSDQELIERLLDLNLSRDPA